MQMTIPTERVDFDSRGTRCAAWLTLPAGAGPHPAVVLVHGLGATHDMMLAPVRAALRRGGHRHTGIRLSPHRGIRRPTAATYLDADGNVMTSSRRWPDLASAPGDRRRPRSGLWGTSLGGMNVMRVAAERAMSRSRSMQCPIVHGPGAARRLGVARRCG